MFTLDKWYLDLVTDDGTALIGYAADLRWHAVRLRYASLLVNRPGHGPHEQAIVRGVTAPDVAGDSLQWRSRPLRVEGEWQRLTPPIEATLLETPAGMITWSCLFPRARATVEVGDARYEGLGYAEQLRLSLAPWDFPFRALRWGRHLSAGHSLVWIEWEGPLARHWVWLDGAPQPAARVVSDGVIGLAAGCVLHWDSGREVRRRSVIEAINDAAPAVVRRLTGRIGSMDEHKRLSRSTLVADGKVLDEGWAIHEEVTW